ncbi:MAG: MBOAT family protein [Acetatifactor sp.]|nr:MBOAT family protein [Acetatifactor sp.]
MVFSSILFLFRFLPIFMVCYFLAPGRAKNLVIFLGSLIFYAWGEPVYVGLMLFSTVSDYIHGRLIDTKRGTLAAKGLLVSSLIINLLLLGFFKYADFLIQSINVVTGAEIPLLELGLPIGISFYTFQTMSYTIDVYRGEAKVQKNLLDFAVFVTMFPQLIAGPIVKYRQIAERLHDRPFKIQGVGYGVGRFVTGLAKKVLLANNIGLLWNTIKEMDYGGISALTAWLGIVAFALQIYFDFSGYSDMAIGLGAIMGFEFPENFNYPYISRSITEFWRRWHISLSSWFREYVYIPLGGNRKGLPRQIVNILIVWMLTGIWHGAGWNFVLWGLWFAVFLIAEKLFWGRVLSKIPGVFGYVYCLVVVLVGWVIFELESVGAVGAYLGAMLGGNGLWDRQALYLGRENLVLLIIGMLAATPLVTKAVRRMRESKERYVKVFYELSEKVVSVMLLLLAIAYVVDASYNPFLYFRF